MWWGFMWGGKREGVVGPHVREDVVGLHVGR